MGCRERERMRNSPTSSSSDLIAAALQSWWQNTVWGRKQLVAEAFANAWSFLVWDARPRLPHLKATWAMWVQNNSSDWVSKVGGYQLTVASVESQLFKAWREGICVQLLRIECLVPGSGCLSCYCILSPEPLWPEVRLAEGLAWSLCWPYYQLY